MAEPGASEESTGREKLLAIRRRRRRARVLRWLALLAVLGVAAFLWLRWDALFAPEEPERSATPAVPAETTEPETAPRRAARAAARDRDAGETPRAERQAAAPEPLPSLAQTDAALRDEAAALSDAPAWSRGLAMPGLLERFVLAVVQASEGTSPRKPLAPLAPSASFRVRTDEDDRTTVHPASYARYDALATAIAGIDAEAAAALYRRFEPLVDRVHARLGAPDTPLREVLERAAAEILAAPRVVGEPALVFHVNHYRYADPKLEGLSSLQKLVLRTGPENADRIRSKVREIALAVGIPARSLPETPVHRVRAGGGG